MNNNIICRFDFICGSNKNSDRTFARYIMPQVPEVGEGINIEGHPYVVHERGWAISRDDGSSTYCYLRVVSLQGIPPWYKKILEEQEENNSYA